MMDGGCTISREFSGVGGISLTAGVVGRGSEGGGHGLNHQSEVSSTGRGYIYARVAHPPLGLMAEQLVGGGDRDLGDLPAGDKADQNLAWAETLLPQPQR